MLNIERYVVPLVESFLLRECDRFREGLSDYCDRSEVWKKLN